MLVYDAGPTLIQYCFNILCLLVYLVGQYENNVGSMSYVGDEVTLTIPRGRSFTYMTSN